MPAGGHLVEDSEEQPELQEEPEGSCAPRACRRGPGARRGQESRTTWKRTEKLLGI